MQLLHREATGVRPADLSSNGCAHCVRSANPTLCDESRAVAETKCPPLTVEGLEWQPRDRTGRPPLRHASVTSPAERVARRADVPNGGKIGGVAGLNHLQHAMQALLQLEPENTAM